VEGLESRVLMHGGPEGAVYPLGTSVPWLTAPITPAGIPTPIPTPTPTPTPDPTPTPTPTPTGTTVGTVAGLTLVNAATDADVGPLATGATVDFAGGATFSVRADVAAGAAPVGSVQFLLDGQLIRTESSVPFSVAGDTAGDYAPWAVATGSHTLTALPFAGADATGDVGSPLTVTITVANAGATPTPTPTPTAFTQLSYATKAANPQGRAEALTATWNNRLYVFGGFGKNPATGKETGPVARSDYYDPANNAWTQVRDLPQLITHAGVAEDANSVYFVAGYVGTGTGYNQVFGSNKVWRYDFAANAYTALPNLPRALSGGGAALLGRKLHYFGGYELAGRGDSTVHLVLDLDNPTAGWQTAAAMVNTRSHMGVAVVGGQIYAIGGQTGYDANLTTRNTVQVYDPATDAWSTKAGMPSPVSHIHSATFVMGDRILVMGGESAHESPARTVYAYTPATNAWQSLTLLPAARFSGVATAINGKIYFTTGGLQTTTWEVTPVA
jgi:N-acetylneuraminic acid mutarotase